MNISLGNLSISEFAKRTGYDISEEDIKILEKHRQDKAEIDEHSDKFHIFDIPFSINVASSYAKELISIITKYEEISKSKEVFSINKVVESDEEKAERIKREKESLTREERLKNPNSIWLVKYHMLVPVKVFSADSVNNNIEAYYCCFINTYIKGRENIPDIVEGNGYVQLDGGSLTGRFNLINKEKYIKYDPFPEDNFVVGLGFFSRSGRYIGHVEDACFYSVEFSLKDAIQTYIDFEGNPKDIYFSHITD